MANAPFPPLFCSTPPPIDDTNDDDDEEFGDFADAYQENLNLENTCNDDFNDDFPSNIEHQLPDMPARDISEKNIPQKNINCDSFETKNTESIRQREDGNKNAQEISFDDRLLRNHTAHASLSSLSEQTSSSTSPPTSSKSPTLKSQNELEEEYKDFSEYQYDKSCEVAKSDSGRSTENDSSVSHEVVGKQKDLPPLSNVVLLEDLHDDSSDDERLSPRNRNILRCDENSTDFFAIHPIDEVEKQKSDTLDSAWPTDHKAPLGASLLASGSSKNEVPEKEICGESQRLNKVEDTATPNEPTHSDAEQPERSSNIESSPTKESNSIDIEDDDEDFANFQDFTSAPPVAQHNWTASNANFETRPRNLTLLPGSTDEEREEDTVRLAETDFAINKDDDEEEDDDDDDFGDFSEAPAVSLQRNAFPSPSPSVSVTKPMVDQLKPILDLMFSRTPSNMAFGDAEAEQSVQIRKLTSNLMPMELALVESAKALDYQWTSSFVRHEFIKSLGIDSRNIFLTEKWNPSMPRFAANLSFDPLQPLKPTSVPLQPENGPGTSSGSKPDVPVAEFDWKSSGLVNPLDGPQAEMGRQPADAAKAEHSIVDDDIENKNENETDDAGSTGGSSTNASAETSTVIAATAGAALPSIATGSSDVNGPPDNNPITQDIDIGLFEVLSNQLPKDVVRQEIDANSEESKEVVKVLEIEGFTSNEATVTLDLYSSMDGEAEVRIENGVISRSTFSGPLKETHIFTPSKNMPDIYEKIIPSAVTTSIPPPTSVPVPVQRVFPIDFDYEKAAAGIIIDETVVHKEYRDVEYNPGFGLEGSQQLQQPRVDSPVPKVFQATTTTTSTTSSTAQQQSNEESDDEFTDFQSVPAPGPECLRACGSPRSDKLSTHAPVNGMILSPAILLPQAISMENKQPKIEWGNSAANIDPDELARIEQLFPQNNSSRNSSKKSSPTHAAMQKNSLSISATIANQSHDHSAHNGGGGDDDDDDWSDFVSVPVPATNKTSPRPLQRPRPESNDDEWSDFVSSAPNSLYATATNSRTALKQNSSYGMPQFNSASWQNANFYNNPLSIYHRNQMNVVPNAAATKLQNNNYSNHNNNNNNHLSNNFNNSNNNFTQYLQNYSATPNLSSQQQKIQVMQDFSTAPSSDIKLYRPNIPHSNYAGPTSSSSTSSGAAPATTTTAAAASTSHFQVGSAKVAPTVSLIPDLGFVAPAMPVHTAIINALPKPSSNFKQK